MTWPEGVRYFQRAEWGTDPDKVAPELIRMVDAYRHFVGQPIRIHVAWEPGGHEPDSEHHDDPCPAVDLHVEGMHLLDQYLAAERFPFVNIGLYPGWTWNGKPAPGLHLGLRLRSDHPEVGRRWWRDPKGIYRPVDRTFLYKMLTAGDGR